MFLVLCSAASNGHQPTGANQSGSEVATAGLFLGNMQADDPPQSSTPFAVPTTSRSDQVPVDDNEIVVVVDDAVITLDDGDLRVEEAKDGEKGEVSANKVPSDVREDIVLAEGWSPVLYK